MGDSMNVIHIFLEILIVFFLIFYAYHIYYYLGLWQGKKKGIMTKAEILEYAGKCTAWAEKNKTFFELFYRRKRFHKYLITFLDKEMNVPVNGNIIVNTPNSCSGQNIDIRYVIGKKGHIHVVQEETGKWFAKKVWIYTFLVFCLFAIGICKEYF